MIEGELRWLTIPKKDNEVKDKRILQYLTNGGTWVDVEEFILEEPPK